MNKSVGRGKEMSKSDTGIGWEHFQGPYSFPAIKENFLSLLTEVCRLALQPNALFVGASSVFVFFFFPKAHVLSL